MIRRAVLPAFARWRDQARRYLAQGVRPEDATWSDPASAGLFDDEVARTSGDARPSVKIASGLLDVLERAACHRDPARFALMYRALWRSLHEAPRLLEDAADDDVVALTRLAKAVDLARHKMTAFVRFREVATSEGARFVAWFRPEHDVLRLAAPFFATRFATMHWTIATPDGIAHWDREALAFADADPALSPPGEDATEVLWLAYYASIFNPARLNLTAMRREMPQRYWAGLPEATLIPSLVAQASERAGRMTESTLDREVAPYAGMQCGTAARPRDATREALDACRRCELAQTATQAVPGDGPKDARIVLVGEQPGDDEDLAGRPFVGPAGRVLREALVDAGIDPAHVYMTNAVKHFRFEPRGKRRIHKTPGQRHVDACRQWLEAELAAIAPAVIVLLGATALAAVTGRRQAVAQARLEPPDPVGGIALVVTYHPSAVLRSPDPTAQRKTRGALVDDLRRAQRLVSELAGP